MSDTSCIGFPYKLFTYCCLHVTGMESLAIVGISGHVEFASSLKECFATECFLNLNILDCLDRSTSSITDNALHGV